MTNYSAKTKCYQISENGGNYAIEALVTVDGRGQMVIPKEVRDITDIHGGEKLVVFTRQKEGEACYIVLVKAENLTEMVEQSWMRVVNENSVK